MTKINSYTFAQSSFQNVKNINFSHEWPIVYILEDGKEMYIGQTVHVVKRLKNHYSNPERKKLLRAHILTDEEYNLSATYDTESWLIQYIAADEKFILQNANGGLKEHNYFNRDLYRSKFEVIWSQLQKIGIAHNDLVQIRNSDLFKYSPYKSLTEEQIDIVHKIEGAIAAKIYTTHIINGEPGTGKSVLGVYLAKYLLEKDKTENFNLGLVIPMTGLRKTLKKVFSKVKGLNSKMVIGPNEVVGRKFDLLIVDEAHRLSQRKNLTAYGPFDKANNYYKLGNSGTQLDWIMRASKTQVLLYDKRQTVQPKDLNKEVFLKLTALHYALTSQLRVLAGNDYIEFVDNVLTMQPVNKITFGDYDLKYFNNINEMIEAIKSKDRKHGLARVVAGYAWTWESKKKNSQDFDIELDGLKLKWNSQNIDWVNSKNAINEVGCIHTVQGYDLNYVGVIIGPELSYDPKSHKLIVDKEKYMDFNGKRSIESIEELEIYIINIYKTLLTRGIHGTYIHAVDKNLEKYILSIIKSCST